MKRLLMLACALLVTGCASSKGTGEFRVPEGKYAAAFDATRDALTDAHFDLERVDARAGIITTKAKTTAGLASPWDSEQSTLDQDVEDLVNQQQRRVRVWFEPEAMGAQPPDDVREVNTPLVARVEVVVERIHKPGWRVETTAVRFSSFTRDPGLTPRGMWPQYAVPFSQDPRLAARIATDITRRLER